MLDFDAELGAEIAKAHAVWCETDSTDPRSIEARNHLFSLLDQWVRKQASITLAHWQGPRPANTGTLAQDVLLKLLTSLKKVEYRGLRPLLSYILTAMRLYLIDLARSAQRRREVSIAEPTPEGELAAVSDVSLAFDPDSGKITILGGDFSEMIVFLRIMERIEQLHALHGLVLQLKLLAGFSVPEIAHQLGISIDETDQILRAARTKLRHEWKKTRTANEHGHN